MNKDYTFVRPLGVDMDLFHTTSFPFYFDEENLDKEVYSWPRVHMENKKLGISYQIPEISR